NLLKHAKITASDERGRGYKAANVTDGDYEMYWATSDGTNSGDLTFTFESPVMINRVMLQEYIPLGQRVKSFVVEYEKDGEWIPVRCGEATTTVGYKRLLRFAPIETKALRVRFTDARGPLCISEAGAYYAPDAADDLDQSAKMPESKPFEIIDHTGLSVTIDLGSSMEVTRLFFLPDQSEIAQGLPAGYSLLAGNDLSDMKEIAGGEFSNIRNNPIMQTVEFEALPARYITLKATEMIVPGQELQWAAISVQ
ncbi:MAG: discoidin domain-containing protein, partial [Muribaculaceae bacterium]|nr:discoidin domain-containing protein [Muribaculaceae bacterium]